MPKESMTWVQIPPPAQNTTPLTYRIVRLLIHLKSKGLRDSTLKPLGKRLERLSKAVDLEKPNRVAEYISNQTWSESYKHNVVNAYNHYVEFYGMKWQRPYYRRVDRIRRVPREEQINKVIHASRAKYALCFSILRDTGMRILRYSVAQIVKPVELTWLRIKDIDLETGLLYPGTAKLGAGRVLKIRASTLAMLKRYMSTNEQLSTNDKLCHKPEKLTLNWCRNRNSVAENLGEPEIKQIRLYDLRHHYATMLYAKTKDIVHVQRQLGHRRITHTLRYIHMVDLDAESFIVKVATNVEESTQLLEQAFEYIGPIENVHVFRKPK